MADPIIIRCSVPDCDWGFEATDSGRMEQCYRAYQQYCIKTHHPDVEFYIHFDLEKLMLSLEK
jgi:hypothetical protein